VATSATNLAVVLHKLGRDTEATVYEDQAAKIRAANARPTQEDVNHHCHTRGETMNFRTSLVRVSVCGLLITIAALAPAILMMQQ